MYLSNSLYLVDLLLSTDLFASCFSSSSLLLISSTDELSLSVKILSLLNLLKSLYLGPKLFFFFGASDFLLTGFGWGTSLGELSLSDSFSLYKSNGFAW